MTKTKVVKAKSFSRRASRSKGKAKNKFAVLEKKTVAAHSQLLDKKIIQKHQRKLSKKEKRSKKRIDIEIEDVDETELIKAHNEGAPKETEVAVPETKKETTSTEETSKDVEEEMAVE